MDGRPPPVPHILDPPLWIVRVELSGLSGETSACLWGQLWAQLVNHSATRGQVSISLAGIDVASCQPIYIYAALK